MNSNNMCNNNMNNINFLNTNNINNQNFNVSNGINNNINNNFNLNNMNNCINNNMNYNINNNLNNTMNYNINNCMNNLNNNNIGFNNNNFNNITINNSNNNSNPANNFQNLNNNFNFPMNNNNNGMTFNNNMNNMNFNNNINNMTFSNNMNNMTFNNNLNNMTFNNNVNNMNNKFNSNNNINNQNLINNNNQIIPFPNMQLSNNNFSNYNVFNSGNFNFNNNYFLQNMQNNFFQQIFFKKKHLQSQNKSPVPIPKNSPEIQSFIPNEPNLIEDLLEILREPNIEARNDDEIIQLFSAQDIISSDLTTEIITEFLNLDPNLLNGFGNKFNGKWAIGEMRGGLSYNPPLGWVGFGLNVINKYDYGNNDWLACDGRLGEWCVGYHGTGRNRTNDEVRDIIKSILTNNLKPGKGQAYKNDLDSNHFNKRVGVGVYCSPDINVLEEYAGFITIRGKKYKVGIMVRCKRDKIRIPKSHKNYWVLDGNFDQLRPYRLLIKQVNANI